MIKQIHVNIPPRHLDGNDLWYQFMVPKSLFTLNVMFQMNFGWKWYRTTSRFICVFLCFPIMVFKWNKGNFKSNLSSLKCTCCCFFFKENNDFFSIFFFQTRMQSLCPHPNAVYRNIYHAITSMVTKEGLLAPLRGMNVVAIGAGPAHALYFSTYEATKKFINGNQTKYNPISHGRYLVIIT